MGRLAHVADTVARLTAALWPHVDPADRLPEPPAWPIRHPAHRARHRRGRDHPGPACVHNLAVVHRTGQAAPRRRWGGHASPLTNPTSTRLGQITVLPVTH